MLPPIYLTLGLSSLLPVSAHIAPFVKGMFCENSTDNALVNPLGQLNSSQWWMHSLGNCSQEPPAPGVFLNLPAGGSFNVEMAENKVCTTMSSIVPPDQLGNFGNCRSYDINTYGNFANGSCITMPNLHTRNKTDAAGSVFAISYTNDITRVNEQNLVVFTVAPNTPFERAASFQVPAVMPPCPPGGCICAWGWVPNGCGAPNMYMLPYRCQVTGWNKARAKVIAAPKPPAYCQGNSTACVKGAKQMLYIYNNDGDNIIFPEWASQDLSPGYNIKNGFNGGAQQDIFTPEPAWNAMRGTWTYQQQSVKRDLEGRPRMPLRFGKGLVSGHSDA